MECKHEWVFYEKDDDIFLKFYCKKCLKLKYINEQYHIRGS